MSFTFKWPEFSPDFHSDAAEMLSSALNRGDKPRIIADDIRVEDINMGTIPPELEILEIGELSTDRFRGIFRLTYAGDAYLTLSTKVQANPLTRPAPSSSSSAFEDTSSVFPSSMPSRGILFAARPLVVPMKLRLSAVRLKAIVVLVVSKQKGITLVFKNDPLDSVDVSSTFDSVAVIQKYLQQEIEGQLREMFREDLPGIIHRLSQRWLSGDRKSAKTSTSSSMSKTTASRLSNIVAPPSIHASSPPRNNSLAASSSFATLASEASKASRQRPARSSSDSQFASPSTARSTPRRKRNEKRAVSISSTPPSPRMTHRGSSIISSSPRGSKMKALSTDSSNIRTTGRRADADYSTSFGTGGLLDEMENYDPTYGLRPDEVRMSFHQSGYSGLAKLANQVNGGLRDLTIEATDEEDEVYHVTVPEEAVSSQEGGDVLSDEEEEHLLEEHDMLHNLDLSEDDVPDRPASDEEIDAEAEDDQDEEEADFSVYEHPPLGAAFSDTATSIFGSPSAGSLRTGRTGTCSQSHYSNSIPSSVVSSNSRSRKKTKKIEYETIPAVGGGIITRPRIYHTASRVQAPDVEEQDFVAAEDIPSGSAAASSTARGPSSSRTQTVRPASSRHQVSNLSESESEEGRLPTGYSSSAVGDGSLDTLDPEPMDPRSSNYRIQLYRQQSGRIYRAGYGRQSSKSSVLGSSEASNQRLTGWSTSRSSTAPTSTHPSTQPDYSPSNRRSVPSSPSNNDLSERAKTRGSPVQASGHLKQPIHANSHFMTMGASHNFMDLVNSNHTLSPYTRTLDTKGFAVRSHPVTPSTGSGGETSSSAGGGIASRPLSSNSSTSQQWRDNGSYFDKHKSTAPMGGVRRRTFKLAGNNQDETSGIAAIKDRRPGSSPLQQIQMGSRAYSSASVNLRSDSKAKTDSRRANSSHGYGSNDLRNHMTMGAIRE